MEVLIKSLLLVIFLQFSTETISTHGSTNINERKTYIVYMGDVPATTHRSPVDHHHSILTDVIGDEFIARTSMIHSYGKSLYGFAANLLPDEAAELAEHKDVVSVFPSGTRELVTTRSWDFLGFTEEATKRNIEVESNTIIGLLDTGIDMGAPSFHDKGYGPPPAKWKGKCVTGAGFSGCNRKVIGASWYNVGGVDPWMKPTPYDRNGHGSHTSSTAAGNSIRGASLFGLGKGTARGAVSRARISMYKVCEVSCSDVNVLAGFDAAIADGVDVISVSLGGRSTTFWHDVISIGSFHAMKKGIPTVTAAGNGGTAQGTVENVAPWGFTATSSNTDRSFVTKVKLGNGEIIDGVSLNTFLTPNRMTPLISGRLAQDPTISDNIAFNATQCAYDSMIPEKLSGKIVLCYNRGDDEVLHEFMRVVGMIEGFDDGRIVDKADSQSIPASIVSFDAATRIERYINSTKNPTAMIFRSVERKTRVFPTVASYASRGPAIHARHILKPDIAAPGTDILAGWSKFQSTTSQPMDSRHSYFNIISGTSMATPHVAGAVAYVKTFHPDWSPAAVKSALMTTAKPVNGDKIENPLNSGSGLIDPLRALHPGLVYDMGPSDYIPYLCNEGYNSTTIGLIMGKGSSFVNCSDYPVIGSDGMNNYPSMHLHFEIDEITVSGTFYRTVTYVGYGESLFEAKVYAPKEMSVEVTPNTMLFNKRHEMKSFKVEVKATFSEEKSNYLNAFLEWTCGSKFSVRSPIVLYRPLI